MSRGKVTLQLFLLFERQKSRDLTADNNKFSWIKPYLVVFQRRWVYFWPDSRHSIPSPLNIELLCSYFSGYYRFVSVSLYLQPKLPWILDLFILNNLFNFSCWKSEKFCSYNPNNSFSHLDISRCFCVSKLMFKFLPKPKAEVF